MSNQKYLIVTTNDQEKQMVSKFDSFEDVKKEYDRQINMLNMLKPLSFRIYLCQVIEEFDYQSLNMSNEK
jgi:hypothetical protein